MPSDWDLDMLTPLEMDVLVHLLEEGDDTPANISENTGRHRVSISQRLEKLSEEGLVINKGHGVHTLTLDGMQAARAVKRERD